ncbi:MAG: putative molybdenum carrier protein [Clostridiales Family XIII bacterium]|nr:putative molybdenum carrier protein [Clostridiales Family XIII bacterium]
MKILDGDRYTLEGMPTQKTIAVIRSGGQIGVDRGAIDAAIKMNIPFVGWVPKGGKAYDYIDPPGLLKDYPTLIETPHDDYFERTAWNVRDAHATLIIFPEDKELTSGTKYTYDVAKFLNRPVFITKGKDVQKIIDWINTIGKAIVLNIAGPRESKMPDVYQKAYKIMLELLKKDI